MILSDKKLKIKNFSDSQADKRDKWIKRNNYYYKDLIKFLKFNIKENSKILEIGSGTGYLLNALSPSYGVGIDISENMISRAKNNYPNLHFFEMDGENLEIDDKFDYVIISDTIGYFEDIQKVFNEIKKCITNDTRIIITYQNIMLQPFFSLAELLHLKMPSNKINWLDLNDISNLLDLSDFSIIKKGKRFLFPFFIPIISWFFNKYLAYFPIINSFSLYSFIIAKRQIEREEYSVSVIIPARNEKGNIEEAVRRCPKMGQGTEIIFVEGNSTDDTYDEIKRVYEKYKDTTDIKYIKQDGKGKGDAVRKGFSIAKGDIFMILDADLTVRPEDLPKFYDAISRGKGEYINGTRLVYPLEKESMRFLNILGNKFFSMVFSWLLDQRLKDTLCGTKVISKKNWQKILENRSYFGDFDPFGDFDLIFGSAKLNLKIAEVPIRYQARSYGETNISRFRHGFLLLKMVIFAMNKIKFI